MCSQLVVLPIKLWFESNELCENADCDRLSLNELAESMDVSGLFLVWSCGRSKREDLHKRVRERKKEKIRRLIYGYFANSYTNSF